MKADLIVGLLAAMGAGRVTNNGVKVRSACPLARWRHSSGRDSHPSFVIFVSDDDESMCKCLSAGCGFKGDVAALAVEYLERGGQLPAYWAETIANNKPDPYKFQDKRIANLESNLGIYTRPDRMPGYVEGGVDVDFLEKISSSKNIEHHAHFVTDMQGLLDEESRTYLRERRQISDQAIERWKLGFHPGARRISIPQYSSNQKLVNIGGRHLPSVYDDPFWDPIPWMHTKGFDKEYYLFGEDRLTSYDGKITGVLVEGMFDTVYLEDQGVSNCIAMLGSHLGKYQIMKILRWFNKLIIVPDGDPPGFKAADDVVSKLNNRMPVEIYPTSLGKDPDNLVGNEIDELRKLL